MKQKGKPGINLSRAMKLFGLSDTSKVHMLINEGVLTGEWQGDNRVVVLDGKLKAAIQTRGAECTYEQIVNEVLLVSGYGVGGVPTPGNNLPAQKVDTKRLFTGPYHRQTWKSHLETLAPELKNPQKN
ncbi:MAG: hypothetical protein WC470_03475 [Candidatus Paceibacterota bacterium]